MRAQGIDIPVDGKERLHRHPVEVGQLGKPLNRDGTVTALVRTDDDRLPAPVGLFFDSMQGQTLLGADRAETGA